MRCKFTMNQMHANYYFRRSEFGARILCLRRYFLTLILALATCTVSAQSLQQKLSSIRPGMSVEEVEAAAGKATEIKALQRWVFDGGHEVVIIDEKIDEIRLHPGLRNQKISLKKHEPPQGLETPVKYLRIGMDSLEALEVAGQPEQRFSGTDWYYSRRHRVCFSNERVIRTDLNLKANLETLDWIRLNFKSGGLLFMNITLAFIMFGVALGIKYDHFVLVVKNPKSVVLGVISQFLALPALTFILIYFIKPTPSVALGMILVASCPGGNISNFLSSIAKGNVALSVSLTAIATLSAIFMTPLNFTLWGSLYAGASDLVIPISIDPVEMLKTVLLLLGAPVVAGIWFSNRYPKTTEKIAGPIKNISMGLFALFIIAAFASNFGYFLKYIHLIILIVLAHNFLALASGFSLATLGRLPRADRRTLTIETGIQNSGLALVLIFNPNLFDGLGGMAFIAAWWGIWHILSGTFMATLWAKRPLSDELK